MWPFPYTSRREKVSEARPGMHFTRSKQFHETRPAKPGEAHNCICSNSFAKSKSSAACLAPHLLYARKRHKKRSPAVQSRNS